MATTSGPGGPELPVQVHGGQGTQIGSQNQQLNQFIQTYIASLQLPAVQRLPEPASQPIRLATRPEYLAGREGLLAELDARLTSGPGRSGPRLVALYGLGGAGKTSVAVEYAHRHLAEVGVCCGRLPLS